MPACTPSNTPSVTTAGPIAGHVEPHAPGSSGRTFSGRSSPARHGADADQLPRLVDDLDAADAPSASGWAAPWTKRHAASESQRDRRQRQERANRPDGLRQPSLGGQRLEPLGRERVVHAQAGRLGATQGVEVAAAAQPLAEVAGDRPHVGSRRRSAGRRERQASRRRGAMPSTSIESTVTVRGGRSIGSPARAARWRCGPRLSAR